MLKEYDLIKIKELIDKYTKIYIKSNFLNKIDELYLDEREIKIGLSIANILSYMEDKDVRIDAFKFVTIISNLTNDKRLLLRCNNIMSRLSIFTFENVLKRRKKLEEINIERRGISLFERLYNEEYHSRYVGQNKVVLNEFQLSIFDAIKSVQNISVSAPTSIGKSFVMKKIIIDIILKSEKSKIIYIVPTRALINEVMNDIQKEASSLNLQDKIIVSCSSELNDDIYEKRCIFVLTQERLNQLCSNIKSKFEINLIVVDEAQKIAEGSRGILLEYTVDRIKNLWPNIKIFFISPLIDNPEVFVEGFSLDNTFIKNEKFSTVNQNLIKLERKAGKTGIDVIYNNEVIDTIEFYISKHKKIERQISYIFKKFNNNENSIIYCNTQGYARKISNEILKGMQYTPVEDRKLKEFSEFLKSYISEKYDLAELINHGIAYHYSMLPSIVKGGIEDLAKEGKIKVITCTSTLLEGVNIQANNIYVYNPRKNTDNLSNLEFWNLAGRAGRMSNDICGNIICLDINQKWDSEYKQKDIENIEFRKDKILKADLGKFINFMKDENSLKTKKEKKLKEEYYNLESVLTVDILNGKKLTENYMYESEAINTVESLISEKLVENRVSENLIKKLIGIKVEDINILWKLFNDNYEKIDEYCLVNPYVEGSSEKFDIVLNIINDIFLKKRDSVEYLKAIRITAFQWMNEKSLREIIFNNFNLETSDSDGINRRIEYRLKFLNDKIRYEFSKYIYAYQEILKEVMISRGDNDRISKLPNYPLYLEFGASKKKTLELMYIGIFREGAIGLSKHIKSEDKENIFIELKKLDLGSLRINNYIKNKLNEIIRSI